MGNESGGLGNDFLGFCPHWVKLWVKFKMKSKKPQINRKCLFAQLVEM